MRILVTGAMGFIGRNLICELENRGYEDIYKFDIDMDINQLKEYTKDCDFVFHLAGINRPDNVEEFAGNYVATDELLQCLKKNKNKASILITSSIQAKLDNPYGKSKKEAEKALFNYGKEFGVKTYIYRLPNVFGKWCRPNYNSVVASFCHNVARGLDIQVNDVGTVLKLVYIDDVVSEFIAALEQKGNQIGNYYEVPTVHTTTLGKIVDLLYFFKESRNSLEVPNMMNIFEKKLYSTYLSYLPDDQFSYPLTMNTDKRGSFTELIKTSDRGQFSVNISKPGITKGNHWHNTKTEKFIVVSGEALIQFRKIGSKEIIEYNMSGTKLEVVDIPTGYTHNIINQGETDLITFMWANEVFDSENPDTYFLEVDNQIEEDRG